MSGAKQKVLVSTIKLVIEAGQAKPAPPVGPALGQAGLKIMDFCKDFNAKTADIKVTSRGVHDVSMNEKILLKRNWRRRKQRDLMVVLKDLMDFFCCL